MDVLALIARCRGFQWDEGNVPKLWERHSVMPIECEQVFENDPRYAQLNGEHSTEEEPRFGIFGHTHAGRNLAVVFTIRGELIRVISARDMNRRERRMMAT